MAPITIHIVRHAQGFHNLQQQPGGPDPHNTPDPSLTELGEQQCAALRDAFPHHDKITHLVVSPMRRTIYTCLLGFAPVIEQRKKPVVALPLAQEVSTLKCDIGSEPEKLLAEFPAEEGKVDLGLVVKGWNDKSPGSRFAPTIPKLDARARDVRLWLRDFAAREPATGPEGTHIVLVTHGGFVHFLTQDWDGMKMDAGTGWVNAEYRSYEFVDPTGQDPAASLKETGESWSRRRGAEIPLTETEQLEKRAAVHAGLKAELDRLAANAAKDGVPAPPMYIEP